MVLSSIINARNLLIYSPNGNDHFSRRFCVPRSERRQTFHSLSIQSLHPSTAVMSPARVPRTEYLQLRGDTLCLSLSLREGLCDTFDMAQVPNSFFKRKTLENLF